MALSISRISRFLIVSSLLAASIVAVYGYSFVAHAATNCGQYTTNTPPPNGYGVVYDVFNPSVVLVKVLCDSGFVMVEAGAGNSNQVVYQEGWQYKNGFWSKIIFTGSARYGGATSPWIVGSAKSIIPSSDLNNGTNFVVAYVCTNQAGSWKCGCSDAACTQGKWQLQSFSFSGGQAGGGFACGKPSDRKIGEVITLPAGQVSKDYCAGLPGTYNPHSSPRAGACTDGLGLTAGELPPGLELGRQINNGNVLLQIEGIPRKGGTFNFTFSHTQRYVEPGTNDCKVRGINWTQDYQMKVTDPNPSTTCDGEGKTMKLTANDQWPDGLVGKCYKVAVFDCVENNQPATDYKVTYGSLPPGLSFSSENGIPILSGTPTQKSNPTFFAGVEGTKTLGGKCTGFVRIKIY